MFQLKSLSLSLLCLLPSLAYAAPLEARSSSSSLYAYGTDIGGLPVFFADGLAYIGDAPPPSASKSTNITFSASTSDSTIWQITPTNSDVSFTDTKKMYINPSSGSYDAVGFTASPSSTQKATGFMFYGHVAFWYSPAGALESLFYATPTNVDGLWQLKWNSDSADDGKSVAVALKDSAPSTS